MTINQVLKAIEKYYEKKYTPEVLMVLTDYLEDYDDKYRYMLYIYLLNEYERKWNVLPGVATFEKCLKKINRDYREANKSLPDVPIRFRKDKNLEITDKSV